MRKQIAAANWKMNLTLQQGETLLKGILSGVGDPEDGREIIFAVPAPYLQSAANMVNGRKNIFISAENIYSKESGAYTGETSAEMILSVGVKHTIIGHSERRSYFHESNQLLAEKVDIALANGITPIFCCGESLEIRESGNQNNFVATQLTESLFHLSTEDIKKVVIAYEPIWAIGTGKTASSQQAQDMHQYLRSVIAQKYDTATADKVSILYGGSVKPANADELFSQPDIDGGLVGGASLVVEQFIPIINALK